MQPDPRAAAERLSTITEAEKQQLLEYLTDYRQKHGKSPTLAEIKDHFGGILSAIIVGHELRAEGRMPK
jgi:hypothetical protein